MNKLIDKGFSMRHNRNILNINEFKDKPNDKFFLP